MFLRSTLRRLPRIVHSNAIRSCTHQVNAQPTESPVDWNTVYKFPSIQFLAGLSKLKIYQSAFTAAGVPVLMGLESLQIVPAQMTELFAVLGRTPLRWLFFENCKLSAFVLLAGITGTISLSVYSLFATKVIGFVYVNPVLEKIRFSYIDFWGRRKNQDLTLKELVSSDERRMFDSYVVVRTTTAAGSLKLFRFGNIVDQGVFYALFGDT